MAARCIGRIGIMVAYDEEIFLPVMRDDDTGSLIIVGSDEFDPETPYTQAGKGLERLIDWAKARHAEEARAPGAGRQAGPGGRATFLVQSGHN